MTDPPSDPATEIDPVTLDFARQARCGFAEVVYGPGKSPEVLCDIVLKLHAAGQPVLATRLDESQTAALKARYREGIFNQLAGTFRWPVQAADPRESELPRTGSGAEDPVAAGPVAVITAGTGDLPVAQEAVETLRWMEVPTREFYDIGVAGPHRLQSHLDALRECLVVVVVAGMEGALPSVVGGHLDCPVIGVPTSVGYGANLGGWSALLSMLNSCAANVTVVNIDGGFKAGYLAGLIATQHRRRTTATPQDQG